MTCNGWFVAASRLAARPGALPYHIEGTLAHGEPLPVPTPLERIMADSANRASAAIVVPVRDVGSDAISFDVTVDKSMLGKSTTMPAGTA
jgi:hypothetical protein